VRRHITLLLLAALVSPAAFAQAPHAVPPLQLGSGMVLVERGWRTQPGNNPAWAQPDFDNSAWQSATLSTHTQLPAGPRWYRLRLHLNPGEPPLALLIMAPGGSFELWIDGKRVPGFLIASWLRMFSSHEFVIPLPSGGGETEIALRVSFPPYLAETYGGTISVYLGGTPVVENAASASRDRRFLNYLPSALFNIALALTGIGVFVLFFAQRPRLEYLWLGLYFLILGASTALWRAVDGGLLPYWVNSLLADPIIYPALICQIEFSFAFIQRKVDRGWRACEWLLFAAMPVAILSAAGLFPTPAYWLIEILASLVVGLGLPILLFVHFRRGNREAGLLILPSLLPAVGVASSDVFTVGTALGIPVFGLSQDIVVSWAGIQISLVDIANVGFLLAIGALLLLRFTRISHQQARAAAELEAAQRIQSLLLRRTQPESLYAHIEVVYRPAQEVGGDFFHTTQIAGATRVVMGDVSGKGMGAAMLVSVLLGALDNSADSNPAAVLRNLNVILLARQQGSFATCVCALLVPDGALTLANAGHLAPYRNGDEIPVESALPLGIAADATYPESNFQLAPGDVLTFLSDGVVEAQSSTGELFGFDRTREISCQSAEEISRAAQAFGQQDDITVLTLQFAPAEVVHA
jgi:phosphoserine phosphatase RsbU/P